MKITKANPAKHYNWIVTPDAYLAMALLGCEHHRDVFKNLGFRSYHDSYELLYPIVFNFKQGLELYIKGLGIIDSPGQYMTTHDLKYLIEDNIKKATGRKTEKIWTDIQKNIWEVIEKYYYGTYILSNTDKNHPDIQNEAERYPEALKNTCYQTPDPCEWANTSAFNIDTVGAINSVEKDIRQVLPLLEQAKRDIMNSQKP